ncbi:hypothetical protein QWY31_14035 [Cytophagales bacterium LB-30]|uniref:Polysaccharide (De)acetylase n=1 Tax=Shiella aurantiaca TaxID=3058365 RepID=A0ABT8F8C2_9BACT|nr:hypothetical protein [Shiella aurantiaca]MDN4166625.1 hypothetical protein [Shiella aurantiaca]
MIDYKQKLFSTLKNYLGWSSQRKIVVFSVDDYGNVRLASTEARKKLIKAGADLDKNRFDTYDSLETAEDLSLLYEVLNSVKDAKGRSAKFTAYALSANIDFEKVLQENDGRYYYEVLPQTFAKLPGYETVWDVWQEGVKKGFIEPQYHGREHLNIQYFEKAYAVKDAIFLTCLQERSWSGLPRLGFKQLDYASAFAYETAKDIPQVSKLALEGLKTFKEVFGTEAKSFTSPGGYTHHKVEQNLMQGGISFVDTAFIKKEPQGDGVFSYTFNRSGVRNKVGQFNLVRNSVFEPSQAVHYDWVDQCMAEIEMAFRFGKPANISSHRVNFCGLIDPNNRSRGLKDLERLLKAITKKWPEVEFISAGELGELIKSES